MKHGLVTKAYKTTCMERVPSVKTPPGMVRYINEKLRGSLERDLLGRVASENLRHAIAQRLDGSLEVEDLSKAAYYAVLGNAGLAMKLASRETKAADDALKDIRLANRLLNALPELAYVLPQEKTGEYLSLFIPEGDFSGLPALPEILGVAAARAKLGRIAETCFAHCMETAMEGGEFEDEERRGAGLVAAEMPGMEKEARGIAEGLAGKGRFRDAAEIYASVGDADGVRRSVLEMRKEPGVGPQTALLLEACVRPISWVQENLDSILSTDAIFAATPGSAMGQLASRGVAFDRELLGSILEEVLKAQPGTLAEYEGYLVLRAGEAEHPISLMENGIGQLRSKALVAMARKCRELAESTKYVESASPARMAALLCWASEYQDVELLSALNYFPITSAGPFTYRIISAPLC